MGRHKTPIMDGQREFLREARAKLGLSQEALGEYLYCTQQTVSDYEICKVGLPRFLYDIIVDLCAGA